MKTPALRVRNLKVAFQGAEGPELAVGGISFDLFAGEMVGLVGESGCGKSVTARALMGLIDSRVADVSFSSLQLAGTELSGLNRHGWQTVRGKAMVMVFQEPATALDPVFTIGYQIVCVLRRHRNISKPQAKQTTLKALESCGFSNPENVFEAYPHQLSGGMRQLALIALAMVTRPNVLIADEPTTALDVSTQSLVLEQLKRLREENNTAILLITHDLGVVAQSCSRAMVMYCGKLVEQSSYADLFHHARHPYTQGLLDSIPRITAGGKAYAKPIPGRVPSCTEYPPGCHFAERCNRADKLCRDNYPAIRHMRESLVACHHPLGSGP